MLKSLKKFFENKKISTDNTEIQDLQLLCGLMVEAANTDGNIDAKEVSKIKFILVDRFQEKPEQVEEFIKKAIEDRNNSKSLFYYTSKINKQYTDQKKILLIETLWEIILSDGSEHDYETSLIRRLSGLLYISDVNSGNARKRALNKISIKQ